MTSLAYELLTPALLATIMTLEEIGWKLTNVYGDGVVRLEVFDESLQDQLSVFGRPDGSLGRVHTRGCMLIEVQLRDLGLEVRNSDR